MHDSYMSPEQKLLILTNYFIKGIIMKKYILLALTLGLASPSYGASSDVPESQSRRLARTVLGAQCWEGALTNDIVTALDAVHPTHQSLVANSVEFILGNTVEPRIGEFIADLHGFYEILNFNNYHIKCFNGLTLGLDLHSIKRLIGKFCEESVPGETMEGLMWIICPPPGFSVPLPPPALRMRMCMEGLNTPPEDRMNFATRFIADNQAEFRAYLTGQIRAEGPMLPAVEADVAAAPARFEDDHALAIAMAESLEVAAIDSRHGHAATSTRPTAPAAAMPADADPELQRALEISALMAEEQAAAAGLAAGTFTPRYMPASWGQ